MAYAVNATSSAGVSKIREDACCIQAYDIGEFITACEGSGLTLYPLSLTEACYCRSRTGVG